MNGQNYWNRCEGMKKPWNGFLKRLKCQEMAVNGC